jgi:transcriptional regulator with XRE-family HTH domain
MCFVNFVCVYRKHQRDRHFYYSLDMKTLAERLAWARAKKDISQERLATLSGVSQSTIGNLEAGLRSSARKLPQIANALGVSALWLAEGLGEINQSVNKSVSTNGYALSPEEMIELVSLFCKTGKEGRRHVLEVARSAALEDPLSTPATDKLELR